MSLYFKAKPEHLQWLKDNELPLGIAMAKNSFFDVAFSAGVYKFEVLSGFDILRQPIFKKASGHYEDFDLTKLYRVQS